MTEPRLAYDLSTKLIDNIGSSLQSIYGKVLFLSEDNGVEDKNFHIFTNGGRAFP